MNIVDDPYISFAPTKHDPMIESHRQFAQPNEILRIYYKHKRFIFYVKNKKNKKFGCGTAKHAMNLIKKKYPDDKIADMQFCYPINWTVAKKQQLFKLLGQDNTIDHFEKRLYEYLLLLI